MSDSERKRLQHTFDRVAALYRTARPGYPRELYMLLADRCGLASGSRVIEIGAGAGQATIPLLELGANVTAVEPGSNMVNELLERASAGTVRGNLEVINATFEDATVDEGAFDLVVSATAFHWVSPQIRFVKSAFALRDHGWLATWSNRYGNPGRPDPFHDAIQPLIMQYAPELISSGNPDRFPVEQESSEAEMPGVDAFDEIEEHVIKWEGRHDPHQIRALFSTFSGWIALPDERRERLLDAMEAVARDVFAGTVIRPYRTTVQLLRRKPR